MSKIAIIGAGAAGLIASITAKSENPSLEIDLFDINNAIGKRYLQVEMEDVISQI